MSTGSSHSEKDVADMLGSAGIPNQIGILSNNGAPGAMMSSSGIGQDVTGMMGGGAGVSSNQQQQQVQHNNMVGRLEKPSRAPTERKRKRKFPHTEDSGGGGGAGSGTGSGGNGGNNAGNATIVGAHKASKSSNMIGTGQTLNKANLSLNIGTSADRCNLAGGKNARLLQHGMDSKKINEYFNKHSVPSTGATNSPMRQHTGGSKSPSAGGGQQQQTPQQQVQNSGNAGGGTGTGAYGMYPPSPQQLNPGGVQTPTSQGPPEFHYHSSVAVNNAAKQQRVPQPQTSNAMVPPQSAIVGVLANSMGGLGAGVVGGPPPPPMGPAPQQHIPATSVATSAQQTLTSGVTSQQLAAVQLNSLQHAGIMPGAMGGMQPPLQPVPASTITKGTQTELSFLEIKERDSEIESSKSKLDEMTRLSDEQKCQIIAHQKLIDQHKSQVAKCIDVVKKLLKEKSSIEKKEARQKCMQNRLRLGQFVTQRVGATFQENWTDGYAFHELTRRQEEISAEREEIDRQKKQLMKKRPAESGRKRNANSNNSQQQNSNSNDSTNIAGCDRLAGGGDSGIGSTAGGGGAGGSSGRGLSRSNSTQAGQTQLLHNGGGSGVGGTSGVGDRLSDRGGGGSSGTGRGDNSGGGDATFLKPDPVSGAYTAQEYYEYDEILKLRQNALKKEDADLQLEMEKLERERNLHIRELKRILNEDQVRIRSRYTVFNCSCFLFFFFFVC